VLHSLIATPRQPCSSSLTQAHRADWKQLLVLLTVFASLFDCDTSGESPCGSPAITPKSSTTVKANVKLTKSKPRVQLGVCECGLQRLSGKELGRLRQVHLLLCCSKSVL
jgi:hypothetical protein